MPDEKIPFMSRFKSSLPPLPPPLTPAPLPVPRAAAPPHSVVAPIPFPAAPRVSTLENPLHKIGFLASWAYIAMLFAFLNELIGIAFGVRAFLPYLFGPPAILAALLSGRIGQIFTTKTGYCIAGLYVFWTASLPFSFYKSASLLLLKDTLVTNYSTFFMIAALAIGIEHVRRLMYTIAVCGVLDLIASYKFGRVQADGRFSFAAGSMANANDFAIHLLISLPFCLLIAFDKGRSLVLRLAMVLASATILVVSLRTGSRSAMLSIGIVGLFAAWKANSTQRVLIAACLVFALILAPILAPRAWMRLITVFDSSAAYESGEAASAVASTAARKHLLMRSIEVTMEHPLTGVGVGEFMDAEAGVAHEEGVRATWQVTHNAYTQVSSETGIPALLCFLGAIFGPIALCFRLYNRTRGVPRLREIAQMSLFLMLSLVCLAANMFFDALAYTYYVPALAGLTVALWNASQEPMRMAGA